MHYVQNSYTQALFSLQWLLLRINNQASMLLIITDSLCRDPTWLATLSHTGLLFYIYRTSFRRVSSSLEVAIWGFDMGASFWNFISAAGLPRGLSNFKAIGQLYTSTPYRGFAGLGRKTSYRWANKGSGGSNVPTQQTHLITISKLLR